MLLVFILVELCKPFQVERSSEYDFGERVLLAEIEYQIIPVMFVQKSTRE